MVEKRDILLMCLFFIAPSICEDRLSSPFRPGAILLQGISRVSSPCALLVWSRSSCVPGCSCKTRVRRDKTTALEAPVSDSHCRLSLLFVWERALRQRAHPEFDSFKEKIHPRLVSRCLISSVADVRFDGKVFWWSQVLFFCYSSSDCWKCCLYLTSHVGREAARK